MFVPEFISSDEHMHTHSQDQAEKLICSGVNTLVLQFDWTLDQWTDNDVEERIYLHK